MSFEEEFVACNFDVLISMLSNKVLHIVSEKRNTSVRPQLFKWWIPLSTVDNAISFHNSYLLDSDLSGYPAFEQLGQGHASSGLLKEVKNNGNVKTVVPKSGRSRSLTKGGRLRRFHLY